MIKHFCDRCGKEVTTRNYMCITMRGMWYGSLENVELCEDCMPIALDKLKAEEAERKARAEVRKILRAAKTQQNAENAAEKQRDEDVFEEGKP